MENEQMKFCKFCGEKIPLEAVICTKCGRQVEDIKRQGSEQIVINNHNTAIANNSVVGMGKPKNKWIALALCLFTGFGHKFYEGKIGMGIAYILTFGFLGIGWAIDVFTLLFKPNPYYV
jgi:hypothetical protein